MTETVPFYGLKLEFERDRKTYMSLIERALESGQVLQGPQVAGFEASLARFCGRRYAVATGSCTDALAFALLAHGIGPGDEVLVTGFSFIASASSICRTGAIPIFADIEARHCMMDISTLGKHLTERTRAIVAVHLYGQTLDMGTLEGFARKNALVLVEDAAQSLGARDQERPCGSLGDVSCLSFDPTKVLASASSAGAVLTDDPDTADHVRMLRYHGRNPHSREHERIGFNSQLATDKAAILDFKLAKLGDWLEEREAIAQRYTETLDDIGEIKLPETRRGSTHNWHKFVLQADNRDGLRAGLLEKGIETMVHYARALPDEPCFFSLTPPSTDLPVARGMVGKVLSLPIYPGLTDAQIEHTCRSVRGFYGYDA